MNEVEGLTWDAVEARIAAGALAILPVGAGAKQHGFHLPMATDRIQAEWLAARLAEHVDALIWPTLAYGHYPAFVAYAGSCSLSSEVFETLLRELVDALIGYGAPVAVLDTGISTIAPIDRVLAGLSARALHLKIHEGPRYRAAAARLATQAHGGHADELETSRMLALSPGLVAMDRSEPSPLTPPGPGAIQQADPSAPNYSRSGSIGDPRGATRETGEALLDAMVEDMRERTSGWRSEVVRMAR